MERKEYTLEKIIIPVCVDCGKLAFYRFAIIKEDEQSAQQYHKYCCQECIIQAQIILNKEGYTHIFK